MKEIDDEEKKIYEFIDEQESVSTYTYEYFHDYNLKKIINVLIKEELEKGNYNYKNINLEFDGINIILDKIDLSLEDKYQLIIGSLNNLINKYSNGIEQFLNKNNISAEIENYDIYIYRELFQQVKKIYGYVPPSFFYDCGLNNVEGIFLLNEDENGRPYIDIDKYSYERICLLMMDQYLTFKGSIRLINENNVFKELKIDEKNEKIFWILNQEYSFLNNNDVEKLFKQFAKNLYVKNLQVEDYYYYYLEGEDISFIINEQKSIIREISLNKKIDDNNNNLITKSRLKI